MPGGSTRFAFEKHIHRKKKVVSVVSKCLCDSTVENLFGIKLGKHLVTI